MVVPIYTYQLATLVGNIILAEPTLHNVTFTKPLNGSGRLDASWTLSPTMPASVDPYELTMPCRMVIYALRDDRPMWGGIIWTRNYDSTTQTIKFSAGEFWSYFDHRWVVNILPDNPGLYDVAGLSPVTFTGTDQNQIARNLVSLAQSHGGGDIGIQLDESMSFINRDRSYPPWKLSTTGDMLRNLTGVIGGQDLVFDVAPNPAGGAPLRVLRQGDPWLGQQGSPHRWEIGGNVSSYTWPSDGTRMLTRTAAVGEGIDQGTPIALAEEPDKYIQKFPLLEGDTGYDSDNPDVLFGHAQADRESARMPVVLPTLITRGDIPPTADEINRGDDGILIIPDTDPFHRYGLDIPVRIVELKYTPSAEAERIEITCAPLLDDIA